MRIDAYAQVQQVYSTKHTQKAAAKAKGSVKDELRISSKGRDIQIAKQAVSQSPDIREDKVNAIKKAIDSGKYHVSPDSFAQKVIDSYNKTLSGSF